MHTLSGFKIANILPYLLARSLYIHCPPNHLKVNFRLHTLQHVVLCDHNIIIPTESSNISIILSESQRSFFRSPSCRYAAETPFLASHCLQVMGQAPFSSALTFCPQTARPNRLLHFPQTYPPPSCSWSATASNIFSSRFCPLCKAQLKFHIVQGIF